MPILSNAKHERFAQEIAKGVVASRAYILAGYKENDGNAATLKGNQRVKERVAELQNRSAERALVTIDSITAELEEARKLALSDDSFNPSAAVAASMGKAKLHGLLVEKSENVNTNYNISDEPMTPDEWAAHHTEH